MSNTSLAQFTDDEIINEYKIRIKKIKLRNEKEQDDNRRNEVIKISEKIHKTRPELDIRYIKDVNKLDIQYLEPITKQYEPITTKKPFERRFSSRQTIEEQIIGEIDMCIKNWQCEMLYVIEWFNSYNIIAYHMPKNRIKGTL